MTAKKAPVPPKNYTSNRHIDKAILLLQQARVELMERAPYAISAARINCEVAEASIRTALKDLGKAIEREVGQAKGR